MRDGGLPRVLAPATAGLVGLILAGCVYADAGVTTFSIPPEPSPRRVIDDLRPSPTEAAYARDTARILFKRRDGERTARFVSVDPSSGYTLCLRAGGAYAALLFPRRIFQDAISQADEDIAILRSKADTAACRAASDWVPA